MTEPQPLTAEEVANLMPRIAAWRVDPDAPVCCPRCEAAGLTIADRSARPYAEWYVVSCPACQLDETINIPLGAPVMGGYD